MYVETTGPDDAPTIVFLHGAMVAGWMWTDVVQQLPEFRCIMVDFPGVHRSNDEDWVSLDDTANKIVKLIKEQKHPVHLVGLSLGAVVGLHVMNKIPDLIDRAVLSGPLARPVTGWITYMQKVIMWLYARPSTIAFVARVLNIPQEGREAMVECARETRPETLNRLTKEIYAKPLPDPVNTIETPTLVLTGNRDTKITRDSVVDVAQLLPNSEAYGVPGVGHQWSAEDPELFAQVIRAWITAAPLPERLEKLSS